MSADKSLCAGCRDDWYNHGNRSNTGECWSLATAKRVQRTQVGTWQPPPYRWSPQETYDCHQPEGRSWIAKDDPRIEGGSR